MEASKLNQQNLLELEKFLDTRPNLDKFELSSKI